MNVISLSWVVTAYLLTTSVFLLPFGRLADIVGRRKLFLTGAIFFTLTTLLCALACSGKILVIARALQGLGSAMIFGTATAILVSIFPPKERGKAIGVNVTGVYLGSALGPSLGGIMTQYLGWRSLFILTVILGVIVVTMGFMYIKEEWADAKGERFDIIGSFLYGLAVVALLYGTTMLPAQSGYFVMGAGLICLLLFGVYEDNIKHPIFDIDLLFKNRRFALSCLAALLNFSACFGVSFLMSLYLQYIKGFDPRLAGFSLLVAPLAMSIGSPIAGNFSDKFDPRTIASIGMTLTASALLTLSFVLQPDTSLYLVIFLLIIFGLGLSFFGTPNTHAAMNAVSKRQLGIASSVINSMRMFGQTISMGTAMLILSLIVGKVKITNTVLPELMTCVRVTFLVFGILSVLGIFASLARGRHKEEI
jgi:EmrB/QacA subfamily drug resistance transporter